MAKLMARLRSLWRGLVRRSEVEAEMAEEFRHHLDLRTEDLIHTGLSPREARRRARIEFGHLDNHKRDARASRGLAVLDGIRFSALDVKLGLRMLKKYPWLSVVSVIGMSVAIAIAAGAFGFISALLDTALPLDEGERVVSIQNNDIRNPGNPDRQSLHDFALWRDELRSIVDLGAFEANSRNLAVPGGGVHLVRVARMSASGFRVARVAPVLGRTLIDADEHPAAPPVLVIAHEEWQRRFGGDSAVVGSQVRLGLTTHTVVGVMPPGFRFPVNHRYWVPFNERPTDYERGDGPAVLMFGRLASGAALKDAQAELTTIGLRTAALFPETHQYLRPRVLRYTRPFFDVDDPVIAWAFRTAQLAVGLLLIVIAVNVAILVYARTTMRMGEITVRTALGASRRRIVGQLFTEAFVLSSAAAAIGLTVVGVVFRRIQAAIEGGMSDLPFWWELQLSAGSVLYVAGLALVAAVIVGVLPALKATGRNVQVGLQHLTSRGSGMHLGKTWTVLIVSQVAIAVAVLPFAGWVAAESVQRATATGKYPADQIVRAWLAMEQEGMARGAETADADGVFKTRFIDRAREVLRRLEADPAVSGATYVSSLSGYPFEQIEGEGRDAQWVFTRRVGVDFFRVFDVPVLIGRGFVEADQRDDANGVIVNRVLAQRVFGTGDVVGRRIRRIATPRSSESERGPGPWLEILGVVPDFGTQSDLTLPEALLYEPVALEAMASGLGLAVRTAGSAALAFAPRMREITVNVDPALQLHQLRSAADADREARRFLRSVAVGVTVVVLSVVLLSAAGIYAMMSFTVAKRRREIAIRSAIGADPSRLLKSVFARASAQLGVGILVGIVLAIALTQLGGPVEGSGLYLFPAVAALMAVVGLLATLGPARRGLAVQPTEALRDE